MTQREAKGGKGGKREVECWEGRLRPGRLKIGQVSFGRAQNRWKPALHTLHELGYAGLRLDTPYFRDCLSWRS